MNRNVFLGTIAALMSLAFLEGCSEDPALGVANIIIVDDQRIQNDAVVIRYLGVGLDQGWIAIYRNGDNGGPNMSERLGLVAVTYGYIDDFVVALDRSATPGDTLWVIMHNDRGVAGAFEYGPSDSTDYVLPPQQRFFTVLP